MKGLGNRQTTRKSTIKNPSTYISFSLQEPATNVMTCSKLIQIFCSIYHITLCIIFSLFIYIHCLSVLFPLPRMFRSFIHSMNLLIVLKISDRRNIHLSSRLKKYILKSTSQNKSYSYYFIRVDQNKYRPLSGLLSPLYLSLYSSICPPLDNSGYFTLITCFPFLSSLPSSYLHMPFSLCYIFFYFN